MTLLALDIGKETGWAAGAHDDATPPRMGTIRCPWPRRIEIGGQPRGYDYGATVETWANEMLLLLDTIRPIWLYIEAPFVQQNRGQGRDEIFIRLVAGYMPLRLEEIASRRRLAMSEINVASVRAQFCKAVPKTTPNGRVLSPDERVNLACHHRGWSPADDHQADAAALFAIARMDVRAKRAA